jgi:hypothetical protein
MRCMASCSSQRTVRVVHDLPEVISEVITIYFLNQVSRLPGHHAVDLETKYAGLGQIPPVFSVRK